MKLNPDCIRDLMLFLEEKTTTQLVNIGGHIYPGYSGWCPAKFPEYNELSSYSVEEILYHVVQLSESGYIVTDYSFEPRKSEVTFTLSKVYYLTPKGHEFVSTISKDEEWTQNIKPVLKTLGSISLSALEAIASGVTAGAINQFLPSPKQSGFLPEHLHKPN